MAMEGMSLVLARTAILDIFLQTFVIAAFGALVLDREKMRARLADLLADGADLSAGAPTLGPRPWRVVAGVMIGAAARREVDGAVVLPRLLDPVAALGPRGAAGGRRAPPDAQLAAARRCCPASAR